MTPIHTLPPLGGDEPPRALLTMIEASFGGLAARDVQCFNCPVGYECERVTAIQLLQDPEPSGRSALELFDAAYAELGEDFALGLFPLVYHQACCCWPFEKVYMPYALHGAAAQRSLYDLACARVTLRELDLTMIGRGKAVPRGRPTRTRFTPIGIPERPECDELPPAPGNPDYLFDHLDRSEFLDRFPLLKLDLARFVVLARATALPSMEAWRALMKRAGVPETLLLQPDFLQEPLTPTRLPTAHSLIARQVSEAFRTAAESAMSAAWWSRLDRAAELLGIEGPEREFLRSLASARSESVEPSGHPARQAPIKPDP